MTAAIIILSIVVIIWTYVFMVLLINKIVLKVTRLGRTSMERDNIFFAAVFWPVALPVWLIVASARKTVELLIEGRDRE